MPNQQASGGCRAQRKLIGYEGSGPLGADPAKDFVLASRSEYRVNVLRVQHLHRSFTRLSASARRYARHLSS